MYKATVYIETPEGKIEKVTKSFDTIAERNEWLIGKILSVNFSYLMVNGEPISVA